MKKRLVIWMAIAGSVWVVLYCDETGSAAAQAKSEDRPLKFETAGPESNQAAITFEKLVHDFGQVPPHSTHTCEFRFTNTGSGVLKIGRIKSSCGCTVPKLDKVEYACGESGTIEVTYSAGTRAGAVSRHVYVNSNDKKNPEVELTIKATIVLKVEYEPQSFRLSLKNENAGLKPITLRSIDEQKFSIKSFKATSDSITAVFDPTVEADRFVLQPKVDIEKLKTVSYGSIDIELTHPDSRKVNIWFNVQKRFTISPCTISLYESKPGQPIKRRVWIINNFGEDFEVESASSRSGHIKVLNKEKVKKASRGTRYTFDVEITPPAGQGRPRFTDELTVVTRDGEQLKVGCKGYYGKRFRKASSATERPPARPQKPSSRQK